MANWRKTVSLSRNKITLIITNEISVVRRKKSKKNRAVKINDKWILLSVHSSASYRIILRNMRYILTFCLFEKLRKKRVFIKITEVFCSQFKNYTFEFWIPVRLATHTYINHSNSKVQLLSSSSRNFLHLFSPLWIHVHSSENGKFTDSSFEHVFIKTLIEFSVTITSFFFLKVKSNRQLFIVCIE